MRKLFKEKSIGSKFLFAYFILCANIYANDININIYEEEKGIEIGENAVSKGNGSIVTSKNGVAIGIDAVATGGNNDGESIKEKLKENQKKLDEIAKEEINKNRLIKEKLEKENKEREVIAADIRYKSVLRAKEDAKLNWENKKSEYEKLKNDSVSFLQEYKSKIEDLNSRLNAVTKISIVYLSDTNSIQTAATELKTIVEKDTNLNLDLDFYKKYIDNYYKVLGDLRKNRIKKDSMNLNCNYASYIIDFYEKNNLTEEDKNLLGLKEVYEQIKNTNKEDNRPSSLIQSIDSLEDPLSYSPHYSPYNVLPIIDKNNEQNINDKILEEINANTIINKEKYEKWKSEKDTIIKESKDAIKRINDPFIGNLDEKTSGKSTQLFNFVVDKKIEIYDLDYEIAYLQWQYEQLDESKKRTAEGLTLLNSKKSKMDDREKKLSSIGKEINDKTKELGFKFDETSSIAGGYASVVKTFDIMDKVEKLKNYQIEWIKKNITDIENSNKISVNTLTEELEKELGISKEKIKQKEAEIKSKLEEVKIAENNYKIINPDLNDYKLSLEYQKIVAELKKLSDDIISSDARLKALKEALTLNNLKNLGENNVAYGTKALAVGDDAYSFGTESSAIGKQTIAFGKQATTVGEKSGTIGTLSITKGNNSYSIGNENIIYGNNNIAFGNKIKIGKENSPLNNAIVFGNESIGVENAVSFGSSGKERQLKFVKAGIEDTDAINKKQLIDYVASEIQKINVGGGTVSVDVSNKLNKIGDDINDSEKITLAKNLSSEANIEKPNDSLVTDKQVNSYVEKKLLSTSNLLNDEIEKVMKKSEVAISGTANAVAMANLVKIETSDKSRHSISAAIGTYAGSSAVAVGYSGINQNRNIKYNLSLSANTDGNFAVGAGVGLVFGESIDLKYKVLEKSRIKVLEDKIQELELENKKILDDKEKDRKKLENLEKLLKNLLNEKN